jgi:hypothetical protein
MPKCQTPKTINKARIAKPKPYSVNKPFPTLEDDDDVNVNDLEHVVAFNANIFAKTIKQEPQEVKELTSKIMLKYEGVEIKSEEQVNYTQMYEASRQLKDDIHAAACRFMESSSNYSRLRTDMDVVINVAKNYIQGLEKMKEIIID